MGTYGTLSTPEDNNEPLFTKGENSFLRILCAFMIIMVVYDHCYLPHVSSTYVMAISRFAMPVFFMISGFFLFTTKGVSENKIWKRALHILKLLIILKILYFIIDATMVFIGAYSFDQVIHSTLLWSPLNSHSWFLYILLADYIICAAVVKYKIKIEKLYFLIPLSIGLDLLLTTILPVLGYNTVWYGEQTYTLIGIGFFFLGYLIHAKEKMICKFATQNLLNTGIVIGFLLSAVGAIYVPTSNLYIGSIIASICIFITAFRINPQTYRSPLIEHIGRNLVVWIYIIHPAIILALEMNIPSINAEMFFLKVPIAFAISLISAEVIHRMHTIFFDNPIKNTEIKINKE